MTRILACESLSKAFGGVQAVRGLTFDVADGEIFGIAGPNGAGKTTLFNLISGHLAADDGRVVFRDQDLAGTPPHKRFQRGIARTFQIPMAFDSQSVLENVFVGAYFGGPWRALGLKVPPEALELAQDALRLVGMESAQDELVSRLSPYDKKRLMIASGVAGGATLLLLDEPFGGLNRTEMQTLQDLIGTLNARGITIVLIEHVLRALFAVSARVLIMHHGERIFLGSPKDAVADERVIVSYLGERAAEQARARGLVGEATDG
jgi:branched-chain amino acid transport system ATP-binding protein